jgi:acyl-CoA synthetase (AMP-forming)/AMP-acid ligase II
LGGVLAPTTSNTLGYTATVTGGQNTVIQIIDLESGKPAPLGSPGEIICKGPQVTRGYRNKPEETAKAIDKDGWLHTGDVGVMDKDGFITIVDRVKDMIIRGGVNIYPAEVEDVLNGMPGIADAAVVGKPDPELGEIVAAFIVLQEGDQGGCGDCTGDQPRVPPVL